MSQLLQRFAIQHADACMKMSKGPYSSLILKTASILIKKTSGTIKVQIRKLSTKQDQVPLKWRRQKPASALNVAKLILAAATVTNKTSKTKQNKTFNPWEL